MTKYQCNLCGKMYETHQEAALCHPDVNIVEEDALPTRDAELHNEAELNSTQSASSICPSCGHMDGYHPEWCMADETPIS